MRVRYYVQRGISVISSLIDLGIEQKILEKKGAWISYNGELIGQGREAAKAILCSTKTLPKPSARPLRNNVTVVGGTAIGESETVE
ncbi:MAG: hypothetical protein ACLUKN_13435 [Bacilli bacterium]